MSSQYCWNARHSNRVCRHHHLDLLYHSWCIWGSALALYRIVMSWTPHGQTLPWLGKKTSVHSLSPTTPQSYILIDSSTFLLSFQRANLWSMTCLSSYLTCSAFPLPRLIWHLVLYILLHHHSLIATTLMGAYTCQHTNCLRGNSVISTDTPYCNLSLDRNHLCSLVFLVIDVSLGWGSI